MISSTIDIPCQQIKSSLICWGVYWIWSWVKYITSFLGKKSTRLASRHFHHCFEQTRHPIWGARMRKSYTYTQRPDQYKMKILVFSMIFKYWSISISTQSEEYWIISTVIYHRTYWINISISMLKNWSISIQYQYPFWKKCDKTSKPSRFEKWRQTWVFIE